MKQRLFPLTVAILFSFTFCNQKDNNVTKASIDEMNLKRGEIISCGATDMQLGTVEFNMSCSEKIKNDFSLAVKLLHSFEYEEAEKAFAKVIDQEPGCAMAYWGVAMCNFHPLWTPPTENELKKGAKAIQIARSLKTSKREAAYIEATGSFYDNWEKTGHHSRCINFQNAMEKVYINYPEDTEAAIFYALSLDAAAVPTDKTFTNQKKAAAILQALYKTQPNHPGIIHYLIHTYDYPELAQQGLEAAKKYASVAPSSAHALHMPSHIFTRLGLWDECINSNLASVSSAQCYAEAAGMKGHWDEEFHAMDYLVYAYLQKGRSDSAKKQLDYLRTMTDVSAVNFKVTYTYAAIPCRYVLENKMWKEAAAIEILPANVPWENFPWQKAIFHFTRVLGAVHTNNLVIAKKELESLHHLQYTLLNQKDAYKANQVAIQIKAAEAWILMKEGKREEALANMQTAADMEDKTEKHPVTPGEVIPARELLGDMLLELNKPAVALEAYKQDLQKHPNRFNGLYGAGLAAEKTGDMVTAKSYFKQLVIITGDEKPGRPEVNKSREYIKTLAAL